MKEKLVLLLPQQFINNRKKPRKDSIRKLILLRKRFFRSQSLNFALSIFDLKAERKVWTFHQEKLWFQHKWNNRNDLAIRQQFRADFRMTPDTFMDIVTLVRNRLEKQDRSSDHRCSIKIGILKNFSKFTRKHLCQSLFFNKVYLKRDCGAGVFR